MGIVYCGPFADAIHEGARYGHEGYAVQVLADGSESRCWVTEFREYRAGCGCGWRGATVYPPTEAGETAAQDEWSDEHLRSLLRQVVAGKVVPATAVLDLIDELHLPLRRDLAAAVAAGTADEPMTERAIGRCEVIEAIERHLEENAADAPTQPTSRGPAGRFGCAS